MVHERCDWTDLAPEDAHQRVADLAREIAAEVRGQIMLSTARSKFMLQRIERAIEQTINHQRAFRARTAFHPQWTELEFGEGKALDPLRLQTPAGNEVELRGKIDRVDLLEDQAHAAVIDYKLNGKSLALAYVYHGISLQLLTYLLVLEANGQKLAGKRLTPVAAFYVELLRKLESVGHPDDATPMDDPLFDLKGKPRGVFDVSYVQSLDTELVPASASACVNVSLKRDGTIGWPDSSDAAEGREFAALLDHTRATLARLADQILAGAIDVAPYRIGQSTPCSVCDFRPVCRFEPGLNRYHNLPPMTRTAVLGKLIGGSDA
jgi:ATP-dependent helicase/nuclease subunit B